MVGGVCSVCVELQSLLLLVSIQLHLFLWIPLLLGNKLSKKCIYPIYTCVCVSVCNTLHTHTHTLFNMAKPRKTHWFRRVYAAVPGSGCCHAFMEERRKKLHRPTKLMHKMRRGVHFIWKCGCPDNGVDRSFYRQDQIILDVIKLRLCLMVILVWKTSFDG